MAAPSKAQAMRPHAVAGAALSGRPARIALALLLLLPVLPAAAQELPACAVTGAASVMINGRPALRLSDVATCPPGLFEPVPGVFVEGEPAVRFVAPAQGCVAAGSANVTIEGTGAARTGDVACPAK